jgi:hypothetical protein
VKLRRVTVICITATSAVGLLAVGVVSPAAGSSDESAHQRTIRVDSFVTEVNFVDVGATGPSLGDEIVFSEKLMRGGKQVGHEGAVCTTVSLERQEAQCVATFWFPDGQVTGQALVLLGSKAPYAGSITGGTGRYEGAEGELRVTPVSDTEGIQTLLLTDL